MIPNVLTETRCQTTQTNQPTNQPTINRFYFPCRYATNWAVPVEGMFTHFADSWGDRTFTCMQMENFMHAVASIQVSGEQSELAERAHRVACSSVCKINTDMVMVFDNSGCITLLLPKLSSQCYLNGPGNFFNLDSNQEIHVLP